MLMRFSEYFLCIEIVLNLLLIMLQNISSIQINWVHYFFPPILSSNATAQKRACNTATCVTHRLADYLSRSGGLGYSNFVPTNVGAQAFGRRKRRGPV